MNKKSKSPRREFIGNIAAGAAAMGMLAIPNSVKSMPSLFSREQADDADQWFNQVKGKHRIVFDVTEPHGIFPFAWPKVFLMTNAATNTPESDCGVVVILRHEAIPFAFEDRLWAKYNFAEVFKIKDLGPTFQAADAATATATRNPFLKTSKGDFKVPGIGAVELGIKDLQASGVKFCVCNAAITVYTAAIAEGMKMNAGDVMKDWLSGLLPGVQVVPSGVWAVGRAQEHDCKYCFVG